VLVTPGGAVLDQPGGKSLMIVDTPEKTRRLIELKEILDVPAFAGVRFAIYEAKEAPAEQLTEAVNQLLQNGMGSGSSQSLALAPLPVGNRILIAYKSDSGLSEARRQLERLDRRTNARRSIYIYPLNEENTASLENTIAAFKASKKTTLSVPGRRLEIALDEPTHSLIIYATPDELRELRDLINPSRSWLEFKQRIASIEHMFESKPTPNKPTL
jgi:type II secretory pathway component GspD/PulD (secretin)